MPCKIQNICYDDDDDSHNNFLASSSPLLSTMLNRKCLHISYLFFGHIETSFKVPIAVRLFNNFSAHMVEASVETEIFWFTVPYSFVQQLRTDIFMSVVVPFLLLHLHILFHLLYLHRNPLGFVPKWFQMYSNEQKADVLTSHIHLFIFTRESQDRERKPNQKPQNQTKFFFFWKIILPFPAKQWFGMIMF